MEIGPIDPEEIKLVTFPFITELDGGTIANAVVTSTAVPSAADTNAAQMVVGSAAISGTDVVQRIKGLLDGVSYVLKAKATDNAGLVHVIKTVVRVKE